jgi:hypothetical protein
MMDASKEETMYLYRVTAWNPKTGNEWNVGLVPAGTREEAVSKGQSDLSRSLVLDAAFVRELTSKEIALIEGKGEWPSAAGWR